MTTRRIITLAAVGTLAAVSTAAFSVTTWLSASAADDATGDYIRLHIGSDSTPAFTYPGEPEQSVKPVKTTCLIDLTTQNIMSLTAGPSSQVKPGIANFGIGVKGTGSSGNGNPCAQTDSSETLTLKPGSSLSGRAFEKVRLDLEMTGNATVKLTLGNGASGPSQEFRLQTGTAITDAERAELNLDPTPNDIVSDSSDRTDGCAAFNSSNPNNSGNDNCLWTVVPDFRFTDVTLTTVSVGTVALEASADFGNDSGHDSLFFLAPPLLCGGETVNDADGGVLASFTMLAGAQVCKPYSFEANEVVGGQSNVLFQPVGTTQVNYRGVITFIRPETNVVEAGTISLLLEYDPELDGSPVPVPVCDNPTLVNGVVTDADFPPGADTWCIATVESHGVGTDDLATTWQLWGLDDPNFLPR